MTKLIGNCYIDGDVAVGFKDEFQETLVIPNGVAVIRKKAFSKYYGLVNIVFPNTLQIIEDEAFYKCSNLRKIILPQGVKEIYGSFYGGAFSECSQLVEADLSNTSIKVLHEFSFCNCKKLQKVKLPPTLIRIESDALRACTKLSSLVLNDGLKIIETDFEDNKHLSILNIPDSVIHIEDLSCQDYIKTIILSAKQLEMFAEYLPPKSKILLRG